MVKTLVENYVKTPEIRKYENTSIYLNEEDKKLIVDFFEYFIYYKEKYGHSTNLTDIQPNYTWASDIHLYNYLKRWTGVNGAIYNLSKLNANKLKSNSEFDDFFLTYYTLQILKKNISFIEDRERLTTEELESFIIWKSGSKDLNLCAAFIILFCTCKGHLIATLIFYSTIKSVRHIEHIDVHRYKKFDEEADINEDEIINDYKDFNGAKFGFYRILKYVVDYYYFNKHKEGYNTSSFMIYGFYALAKMESVPLGFKAWSEWKKYWGLELEI